MLFSLLRPFQSKHKFGSYALCADHIDILFVSSQDFPNNGKPKPGAVFVFVSGGIGFVETVENLRDLIGRDPLAVVFDGYKHIFSFPGSGDGDRRMGRTEFNGIVQQVIDYLLDFYLSARTSRGL